MPQTLEFRSHMLREIYEQPGSVLRTALSVNASGVESPLLGRMNAIAALLPEISRIVIAASGTSRHAGLAGKYMLESLTGLAIEVNYASEYQYSPDQPGPNTLVLVITQSGETADTLGALRKAKAGGSKVIAISNVGDSTIMREADAGIQTQAGPEIAIPSTKAFTAQLTALYLFSLWVSRHTGSIPRRAAHAKSAELLCIPEKLETVLRLDPQCYEVSKKCFRMKDFVFAGRGIHYPIALEGALKLKEVSYVHAEGYPLGEVKHGPLAVIDEDVVLVLLATYDPADAESMVRYEKIVSTAQEFQQRPGRIIAIANLGDDRMARIADDVLYLPHAPELLLPILEIVPLQLIAHHIAVLLGNDVDHPRHLVKAVITE